MLFRVRVLFPLSIQRGAGGNLSFSDLVFQISFSPIYIHA